jgi:site-specific recombinase XerD
VQSFVDRHGKRRLYLRRPGFTKVALPGPLWSPAFMQAYQAALADERRPAVGQTRTQPGTFDALIVEYYVSTNFVGLAASTQAAYRRVIEKFRADYGGAPVTDLRREHVRALVERKAATTPTAANDLLKKLKILCRFAIERGYRDDDPTSLVRRARIKSGGHRTWSEDDIKKFRHTHTIGTRERLALELLLNTGQRRSDVVGMGPQHVRDGQINVRQRKTGQVLRISLHRDLATAIEAAPGGHLTFLVARGGAAFSPDGFSNWFKKACDSAGVDADLSPHGLRKAAARRLAEAGCTTHEIMSIGGWRNIREVETYTQAVNQAKLATSAIQRLEVSNLSDGLDKSERKSLK